MFINKIPSSRLRLWTLTNISFTSVVLSVCLLEVLSLYLKTGETLTWTGVTLADSLWVIGLWWVGCIILYAILDSLTYDNRHIEYLNKTGRWHWAPIVILAVVINALVEEPTQGPIIATELVLHAFTKMGYFIVLYPFIDAVMEGVLNPYEKGRILDRFFITRIRNTTAWRRYVFHAGRLQWDISLVGPRGPEFMVTVDPDGEEQFHLWINCGLFGIGFSSAQIPYLSSRLFKGHYRLGFYTCTTHLCIALMENEDFRGWQGGRNFIFHWETMLKGKETVECSEEVSRGCFQFPTIPQEGYPEEQLTLQVTSCILKRRYSRWFSPPDLERFHVFTKTDEKVARVPGKGENGWDCDDEYGIDVWLAARPITAMTPRQAAQEVIADLAQTRSRR